jgi:flavin reductase (DIM6/NTAB) family NADH-FMN oxidoreductase RutF
MAIDLNTRSRAASVRGGVGFDAFCELFSGVPTAVSVVTSRNGDVGPHGTTVSAFCSLSLTPPLVLVALDRSSDLLALLEDHRRFGINVLAVGQEEIGTQCARKGPDKLAGVEWRYDDGLPRIDGSAAWLACEVMDLLEGGDHVMVVGLVSACEAGRAEPLVYHRRRFLRLAENGKEPAS